MYLIITFSSDVQVDASILITANVPSAKKIIIHGPQASLSALFECNQSLLFNCQAPVHVDDDNNVTGAR